MDPRSEELVAHWLSGLGLPDYLQSFIDNGYDDLAVCQEIGADDLDAIGVKLEADRSVILGAVEKLRGQVYTELDREFFPPPSFDGFMERSPSFLLDKYTFTTDPDSQSGQGVFEAASRVELSSAWSGEEEAGKLWQAMVPAAQVDDYKMFSVYGQNARSSSPPSLHLSFENKFEDDILERKASVKSLSSRNGQETTGPPTPAETRAEEEEEEEEEQKQRKDQGLKDQLVGTLTRIFRSLSFKRSTKKFVYEQHRGDLKASEMMMGERDRMNLMLQVKSGKLSVFEAVQRVNSYRCNTANNNHDNSVQQQHMAKSRSMDEQNLARHHHHHHLHQPHHHQQHRNHDHRCHGDRSASPFATRRFEHLRLPPLSISDRNRNQDFPAATSGKTQKSSPPPLPPLPPSAIMESLSAERLHPSRHYYHHRNEEEEEEEDGSDVMRMSANHHPPDVLADHPTYHNYRRLYHHHHHHHQPHQRHIHGHHHHHCHGDDDVIGIYRCPLCSVRKSRSLHLAAPRVDGANHTPLSRMEWDSTEELKTLKFLKQCTAERLKAPSSRMLRAQDDLRAFVGDTSFINHNRQTPAAPDCVPPSYQKLAYSPHFAFHSLYQQYHYHHRRQNSLPSSSSSSCDGWNDVKSDSRSFQGQGSGTLVDLFKRIGLQHLTEKFLACGKSSLDELMELKGDDLVKLGVKDELDRVKLLTVAQFMLDCRQYFGSVQTIESQSATVTLSRDVSIQTANGREES